ncbi:MAG: Zn-dependent hydrolase [Pseudomonadota bacterium]
MLRYARALLVVVWVIPLLAQSAGAQTPDRVDGTRLNETMMAMRDFGGTPEGGSTRVAYSQHNKNALEYLAELMRDAGLETHIDFAGNLIGRKSGSETGLKPLVSGSHVDTVPNGGHYDGVVGTMSAIEVARTLNDAGYELRHPLEIVAWSNEEGGKTGSRAWNGSVLPMELSLPSLGDKRLGDGMRFLGGDPKRLAEVVRPDNSLAAYVELHVEQGAFLDADGISIGVVEGIVGIKRWNVTVEGFANHAGTTPMDQRQDALYAAAQIVTVIRDVIVEEPGTQVGTVGRLRASPGAPNVIPGEAVFSLEIRDLSMAKIDRLFARIDERANRISDANSVDVTFTQFYESPAAITDERISAAVSKSAEALDLSFVSMPSGAGHDAQSLAALGPLGMIFVPSFDGVSHAPSEFTSPEAITDGANVLLRTLLELDRTLP